MFTNRPADHSDWRSPTWCNEHGEVFRVPTGKLRFRYPGHRELRRTVFVRDEFTCQWCGARPPSIPENFDGNDGVWTTRIHTSKFSQSVGGVPALLVLDHIVSRRNGGSNHPANLQALCDPCNSAKAGLVDARYDANRPLNSLPLSQEQSWPAIG